MPTIRKKKKWSRKDKSIDRERIAVYSSARWIRLRALKFANTPLCELCAKEGKTTVAEDIHHIVSFMSTDDKVRRYQLAYDYDNLMSLCKRHHQLVHNAKGIGGLNFKDIDTETTPDPSSHAR